MIYLDNHATTPCDPRVVEAMLPYFSERYANPASEIHRMGREARIAVEKARKQVAELVGAESEEIIFTGSATESNNLAILGLALSPETQYRNHIFASSIEHKSVISPCRVLEQRGFDFKILAVDKSGHVIKERADEVLDDHSLLVSIQAANNEIGTIQNIKTLSGIVHECGGLFHCDAAQAVGKIPIDVQVLNIDLMSISAHKMYGPKGIGALYIRGGGGNSKLKPILYGGEQEFGLRAGTLKVPVKV
jgi:cysteine desulfurase